MDGAAAGDRRRGLRAALLGALAAAALAGCGELPPGCEQVEDYGRNSRPIVVCPPDTTPPVGVPYEPDDRAGRLSPRGD